MATQFFTSESVTEGHPDKICDLISDAVLDSVLSQDREARVACETICKSSLIMVFGELTTKCFVDIAKIAKRVLNKIGYNNSQFGLTSESCSVITNIVEQSSDIAIGVDKTIKNENGEKNCRSIGAGDQGLVFGFACDETEQFMPAPIFYAHALSKKLAYVRKKQILPYLGPDGKTQVTVKYCDGEIDSIDTIVISTQHLESVSLKQLQQDLINYVVKTEFNNKLITPQTKFYINPTGRFVVGGPIADSGLTGRKIIVDTYGGYCRHGGGAFSGKDPTKVDRSGAYMARYVAKNVVAAKLAKKCEVQIAYAIGVSEPVSISLTSFNTSKFSDEELVQAVKKIFNFSPMAIIDKFDLLRPIYGDLACYGHFGRDDLSLPWEELDGVDLLRAYFNF